jgi:TIR domain
MGQACEEVRIMGAIFISYRRDDTEGQAGRLFEDLSRQFGRGAVFMDVAAIEPGRDFRRVIDQQVAACGVLLALIGRKWIDAVDEVGNRRLNDPMDFVRLETASALRRDIPVVPVLVHGARMPRAEQLPDELKEFAFRNAVELTHARWDSDVQVLVRALRPYVQTLAPSPATEVPSAPAATPGATRHGRAAAIAALAVAGIGGAWWLSGGSSAQAPSSADAPPSKTADAGPPGPGTAGRPAPGAASTVAGVNSSAATRPPKPGSDTKAGGRPAQGAPAAPVESRVSLVGRWPASNCVLIIDKDDGKQISGNCDTGMEHRFAGHYIAKDTVSVTITRIDKARSCTLTAPGKILILGPNAIEISQAGWNGCEVNTGPAVSVLKRG